MKKKLLFLAFAPIIPGNGVAKKIIAQKNAFVDLGYDVDFCYFKELNGQTVAIINDHTFFCLGNRLLYYFNQIVFFKRLSDYIKDKRIELIYIRYEKNANYALVNFLRRCTGVCKRIMEIPTFPYDSEIKNVSIYRRLRLWEEKYFRNKFSTCLEKIVTFTDDDTIYGVSTIKISNAIDENNICLVAKNDCSDYDFSLIGVANLAFWHGYDRMILGIKKYYENGGKKRIIFRIVGDGNLLEKSNLEKIVIENGLENCVKFYGNKSGSELDRLFNISDMAVGCLGCHRKKITTVKSLKNVEYSMRGVPFIYSENNDDFDNKPFVKKVPADDSPIDLKMIMHFYANLNMTPTEIRKQVAHLTWVKQMEIITEML